VEKNWELIPRDEEGDRKYRLMSSSFARKTNGWEIFLRVSGGNGIKKKSKQAAGSRFAKNKCKRGKSNGNIGSKSEIRSSSCWTGRFGRKVPWD